jgi:hypothetical protein
MGKNPTLNSIEIKKLYASFFLPDHEGKKNLFRGERSNQELEPCSQYCALKVVLNHIFIRIWTFLEQLRHPQCPVETSSLGQQMDFVPSGAKIISYTVKSYYASTYCLSRKYSMF